MSGEDLRGWPAPKTKQTATKKPTNFWVPLGWLLFVVGLTLAVFLGWAYLVPAFGSLLFCGSMSQFWEDRRGSGK